MPRKLVTIRRVTDLAPIPGADRIVKASIDGWTCVVAKDDFEKGDLGLYFECDSLLPAADPRWESLVDKPVAVDGTSFFRIKTRKVRGIISQGLFVPLRSDSYPEITAMLTDLESQVGKEVAAQNLRGMSFEDILGVRKWEEPGIPSQSGSSVDFPTLFIAKTEQERIQNIPDIYEKYADDVFQETTKMDGSSTTIYFIREDSQYFGYLPTFSQPSPGKIMPTISFPNGRVGVCSRNKDLSYDPASVFWTVALKLDIPAKLAALGRNLALQGELCGSSIQSNREGFKAGEHDFFLFAAWDVDAQVYLPPREVHEQLASQLGIQHVPVHGYHPLQELGSSVSQLLDRAEGNTVKGRRREGIVLKHIDNKISFKVISNKYLLKHGG